MSINTSVLEHITNSNTNTNIPDYMDDITMDSSIQGYIADTSTMDDTNSNTSMDTLTTSSYSDYSIHNLWLQDIPEYVDATMNYTPDPICYFAGVYGSFHQLESMLDASISVNETDPSGDTLLHLSSKHGRDDIVLFLLQRGATLDATNNNGETPLISSIGSGRNSTITLLLNAGAAINIKDNYGQTALIVATKLGNSAVITMLLHYGANIHITDKLGMSALHHASQTMSGLHHASQKSLDIVILLLQKCADITLKTSEGKTPENLASSSNNREILEYLREQAQLAPMRIRLAYQWLQNTWIKQNNNNTK